MIEISSWLLDDNDSRSSRYGKVASNPYTHVTLHKMIVEVITAYLAPEMYVPTMNSRTTGNKRLIAVRRCLYTALHSGDMGYGSQSSMCEQFYNPIFLPYIPFRTIELETANLALTSLRLCLSQYRKL
ncbi:hypothetical protein J6590_029908 [Homalodisca vitripennis]|nr:hypothetical protein J6590_029908 [Homalodisca vitripennis]